MYYCRFKYYTFLLPFYSVKSIFYIIFLFIFISNIIYVYPRLLKKMFNSKNTDHTIFITRIRSLHFDNRQILKLTDSYS